MNTELMSKARWRLLANTSIYLAAFIFVGSFVALALVMFYYAGHRPHAPQPAVGQTVRLPWVLPPSYGNARDAALMFGVFSAGFYSSAIFGIGWAIRIYILGEDVPIQGEVQRPGRLTRELPPDDSN
jgi:hypothetical protein